MIWKPTAPSATTSSKKIQIAPNKQALHLGREYAETHLEKLPLRLRKADKVGNRIFVEGNSAAGLGAVYGGATAHVVDIGCGPGYTSALLLDAFPDSLVTGLDSSHQCGRWSPRGRPWSGTRPRTGHAGVRRPRRPLGEAGGGR